MFGGCLQKVRPGLVPFFGTIQEIINILRRDFQSSHKRIQRNVLHLRGKCKIYRAVAISLGVVWLRLLGPG